MLPLSRLRALRCRIWATGTPASFVSCFVGVLSFGVSLYSVAYRIRYCQEYIFQLYIPILLKRILTTSGTVYRYHQSPSVRASLY